MDLGHDANDSGTAWMGAGAGRVGGAVVPTRAGRVNGAFVLRVGMMAGSVVGTMSRAGGGWVWISPTIHGIGTANPLRRGWQRID